MDDCDFIRLPILPDFGHVPVLNTGVDVPSQNLLDRWVLPGVPIGNFSGIQVVGNLDGALELVHKHVKYVDNLGAFYRVDFHPLNNFFIAGNHQRPIWIFHWYQPVAKWCIRDHFPLEK
jgi:hypothetical protein